MPDRFEVTKNELLALIEISDSMMGMVGGGDRDFDAEAKRGKRAIDAILKRAGLQRKTRTQESITVPNPPSAY